MIAITILAQPLGADTHTGSGMMGWCTLFFRKRLMKNRLRYNSRCRAAVTSSRVRALLMMARTTTAPVCLAMLRVICSAVHHDRRRSPGCSFASTVSIIYRVTRGPIDPVRAFIPPFSYLCTVGGAPSPVLASPLCGNLASGHASYEQMSSSRSSPKG